MNVLLPKGDKNTGLFFLSFFILASVMLWENPQYDWTLLWVATGCTFVAAAADSRHRGQSWLECILFGVLISFVPFAAVYLCTMSPEVHPIIFVVVAWGICCVLWLVYNQRLYRVTRHPWAAIFGFLTANGVVQYVRRVWELDLWIAVVIGFVCFLAIQAVIQSAEVISTRRMGRNRYDQKVLKELEEDLEKTFEEERKKK